MRARRARRGLEKSCSFLVLFLSSPFFPSAILFLLLFLSMKFPSSPFKGEGEEAREIKIGRHSSDAWERLRHGDGDAMVSTYILVVGCQKKRKALTRLHQIGLKAEIRLQRNKSIPRKVWGGPLIREKRTRRSVHVGSAAEHRYDRMIDPSSGCLSSLAWLFFFLVSSSLYAYKISHSCYVPFVRETDSMSATRALTGEYYGLQKDIASTSHEFRENSVHYTTIQRLEE